MEREVGVSKTWGQGGPIEMRFSIFSSNAANHLLEIERCVLGTCASKALYLSRANAVVLRGLLANFGDGKLTEPDLDGVYK